MWRRRADGACLVEVIPPRGLEGSMSAARAMLGALAGERLSLEIAATGDGPRWYIRCGDEGALDRMLAQLRAAYPQALVEPLPAGRGDLDPMRALGPERALAVELLPAAEPALPLHCDWRHERDPLAGVLAAADVGAGERVVCRLALAPAPSGAAEGIRRRRDAGSRGRREDDVAEAPGIMPLVALLAIAAAGLQAWRWYEAGEWALLAAGSAVLVGLPLLGALAVRLLARPEPLPPSLVERKLAAPLVAARLEVCAFARDPARLRALAAPVAAAYAAYDDPWGGALRPGKPRPLTARAGRPSPLLLSAAEAAALWHLPDDAGAPGDVRRTAARRLPSAPGHATQGARVGATAAGRASRPVYLPAPLLHRNHLIVAKTRRGKSTLLRHLAAATMERAAGGFDDTALVVVDPHQDLAEAVLASVPDALAARTVYLDFANLDHPVGLNLLDVALFPARDRTTEHIVTMMNRLWPANWGPRMEGALRASLASLHELNAARPREHQFTLLDVAPLLTDGDWRTDLLKQVRDPAVRAWWRDNYDGVNRTLQQQTANPVTSKIGRFTVTEASRLVLGQARSTFDPRQVIREGGVLVVNTATGTLGEGAASLVGATLLNLTGLMVEEQVALPPARRRRLVALVDESSTLGAVDYTRMLSELGKYGASFVLVTQSLAKLDVIDRSLVPTILANADGLTVFQVSAEDARRLLPELGGGLEIEDLVSLDDFTCHARLWDGRGRPPAFTLRVDPPPAASEARARAIARDSARRYGRPRDEVAAEIAAAMDERLAESTSGGRSLRSPEELDEAAANGTGEAERGAPGENATPAASEHAPKPQGKKRYHAASNAAKEQRDAGA